VRGQSGIPIARLLGERVRSRGIAPALHERLRQGESHFGQLDRIAVHVLAQRERALQRGGGGGGLAERELGTSESEMHGKRCGQLAGAGVLKERQCPPLRGQRGARPSRSSSTIPRQEGFSSRSQRRNVCPSTSSMATNTWSPQVPMSYTVTTFGCLSRAMACASASSRLPSLRDQGGP